MLPICVSGGGRQYHIDGGAPRRDRELPKGTITMGPQAAGSQWTPRELKMVLTLFKNGLHLHPNAPKSVGAWGSVRPRPLNYSEGERLRLPV